MSKPNYVPEFRQCRVCKKSDFRNLLDKTGMRTYRHSRLWTKRCQWFQQHPGASLTEAKDARIPGVSSPL